VRVLIAASLFLVSAPIVWAQNSTEPALHHRTPADGQSQSTAHGQQRGTSTLPPEASGEYMLDEAGSVVQITIENGVLSGYISRFVDASSSLTYLFDRTTIHATRLTFTTSQVHGIWYSFEGTIVRGDARTVNENGFYRLTGAWVEHDESRKSQSHSTVNLKSTPRPPSM
jgi:hypothetical protein